MPRNPPIAGRAYKGPEDLSEAGELSQVVAEELIRRGEYMVKLGQRLLAQAMDMHGLAAELLTDSEEKKSAGKRGMVGFGEAVDAARNLGTFTRKEFAEALGLNAASASTWLSKLLNNKPHPIIERVEDRGGVYSYIIPDHTAPASRTDHARAVERTAGVGADSGATGVPVAHTKQIGRSGKPGLDKKKAEMGFRVKRGRVGT